MSDEELELSDVPMDEDNSDFSDIIDDESAYIHKKIFANVNTHKVDLSKDEVPEEPEEELDKEEQTRLLIENLSSEQFSRYEFLKRASVNRGQVKKLAYSVLNQSVSPNVAIILGGVGKLFVGEIVEKARDVKKRMDHAELLIKIGEKREMNRELKKLIKEDEANNQPRIEHIKKELKRLDLRRVSTNGPLQPEHIREAWRLYQLESETVPNSQWRRQGERDGMMFR